MMSDDRRQRANDGTRAEGSIRLCRPSLVV
jgi:hypothetical protein